MLTKQTNNKTSHDWHDYYSRMAVERANMGSASSDGSDEEYICVGMATEPEQEWNAESHKYDGPVVGQGVWVVTNYSKNGHLYLQNPVKVIVDMPKVKGVEFGKKLRFKGLKGYFSRKNYSYTFRADSVEALN